MKMKKKSNKIPFLATVSPAIIWLILFLVLPLLYIVGISFMKKGLYGGVIQTFDLTAYKTMFQSKYMKILLDSLWLSLKTTGLCLLFGYPFAYIISNTKKKWKPLCPADHAAFLDQFSDPNLRMEQYPPGAGNIKYTPDAAGNHKTAASDALYRRGSPAGYGVCADPVYSAAAVFFH